MTAENPALRLGVASNPTADGTFVIEISVGEDRSWALTAEEARAHAAAFAAAGTIAQHETALLELLRRRGIASADAVSVIAHQLRPRRPYDPADTAPLRLHGAVGLHGPFVEVHLDDTGVGLMSPEACFDHAAAVLRVITAVALDQVLHHVLTTDLALSDAGARALIAELPTTWPGAQTTP